MRVQYGELLEANMAGTVLPSAAAVTLEPLLAWAKRESAVNAVQKSMMTGANVCKCLL